MSENNIYEIASLMSNKNVVKKDMSEAMGLVQQMFEDKYINKMNRLIGNHQTRVKKNPSKEVNLLKAWKEFVPKEQHANLDQMINAISFMDTYNSIRNEYSASATSHSHTPNVKTASLNDPSIHDDGVYDVDSKCALNKNSMPSAIMPIFFMMLLQKG